MRSGTTMAAGLLALLGATGACAQDAAPPVRPASAVVCTPAARMPLEGRASAYDSTLVEIAGEVAKICYGRPSLKGRQMIGGSAVPYGRLWRTGANEPTILHLPFAATVAGIAVEPGSYSIYTLPGETEWTVIVNRSTSQWGHESQYTAAIEAQEVGRARVPAEALTTPVETFTIRSVPGARQTEVVLEWDHARVVVPIARR